MFGIGMVKMADSSVLTQKKSQNNILLYNNLEGIRDKLDIIKKAILTFVPAEKIYLFGSYAYGRPTKNSDIDIYVVIPDDFNKGIFDTLGVIATFLRQYNIFKVDLFLVEKKRFLFYKENSSFEETICNKGIVLYENT